MLWGWTFKAFKHPGTGGYLRPSGRQGVKCWCNYDSGILGCEDPSNHWKPLDQWQYYISEDTNPQQHHYENL